MVPLFLHYYFRKQPWKSSLLVTAAPAFSIHKVYRTQNQSVLKFLQNTVWYTFTIWYTSNSPSTSIQPLFNFYSKKCAMHSFWWVQPFKTLIPRNQLALTMKPKKDLTTLSTKLPKILSIKHVKSVLTHSSPTQKHLKTFLTCQTPPVKPVYISVKTTTPSRFRVQSRIIQPKAFSRCTRTLEKQKNRKLWCQHIQIVPCRWMMLSL